MTREVCFLHYTGHKTFFSLSYNAENECLPTAKVKWAQKRAFLSAIAQSASLTALGLLQAVHGGVIWFWSVTQGWAATWIYKYLQHSLLIRFGKALDNVLLNVFLLNIFIVGDFRWMMTSDTWRIAQHSANQQKFFCLLLCVHESHDESAAT